MERYDKPMFYQDDFSTSSLMSASYAEQFAEIIGFNPETGSMIISSTLNRAAPDEFDPDPTQMLLFRFRFSTGEDDEKKAKEEDYRLPGCKEPGMYSGAFSSNLELSAITKSLSHKWF